MQLSIVGNVQSFVRIRHLNRFIRKPFTEQSDDLLVKLSPIYDDAVYVSKYNRNLLLDRKLVRQRKSMAL